MGIALLCIVPVTIILGIYISNPNQKLLKDYQRNRIMTFFEPENNEDGAYQQKYSVQAIGSGQLSGKGLNNDDPSSLNNAHYIAEGHTDFIFAVIGESLGFAGCLVIILLYMILIFRLWQLMRGCRDKYGKLIIAGIMFMYMFHIFENIGMTIGVMPITGIPLPFISYGGTNFVTNMIGIGLVMSVCFYRPEAVSNNPDELEI